MATQCRKARQHTRNRLIKLYAYLILAVFILIGGVGGFFLGRHTAPEKIVTVTETVTQTVEVPVYESEMLVDTAEVFLYDVPLSNSLQRYIYEICADKSVPVPLVLAMIEHESKFNPETVSSTDDYGLMQINRTNFNWLEEKYHSADMLNPYQNVFCGISIIGSYIGKYGDYGKALMAYNLGDYGAQKAWSSGITSTAYSENILSLMKKYEEVAYAERD